MTFLSVVVIGRNEGERLKTCLESVARVDRQTFETELIYVDSGSSDDSVALAASVGARTIALRPERPTAALGRNRGWREARGEFVLFLDGDTLLEPYFAAAALEAFRDPDAGVVWGHRRELHPERSPYIRVLDLDWIYKPGPAQFCGGDAMFRRDLLVRTGGFDETLIAGEEPELCRRILALGSTILHIDRPMTGHDLAMTSFGQYWRRATRAGHAYAEVSERFATTAEPFWLREARRNRAHALSLLAAPVVAGIAALALRAGWPIAASAGAAVLLLARTAWKARWKSRSWATLVLYAVHSHLQQLPIFVGQMRYRMSRRRGQKVGLVEYRGAASKGQRG